MKGMVYEYVFRFDGTSSNASYQPRSAKSFLPANLH